MEKEELTIGVKSLSKNLILGVLGFPLNALLKTIIECKDAEELAEKFEEISHYAKITREATDRLTQGLVHIENAAENEVHTVNIIVIRTLEDLSDDNQISGVIKSWTYVPYSVDIVGNEIWMEFDQLKKNDAKDYVKKVKDYLSKQDITVKSVTYY